MKFPLNVQYCIPLDQFFLFYGLGFQYLDAIRDIIYDSKSVFMMIIFMRGYKRLDTAIMCLMILIDFLEEQPYDQKPFFFY